MSTYAYGECCCVGWYDVYRGHPLMNDHTSTWGRMGNSTQAEILNWSPFDGNPPWSVSNAANRIKHDGWKGVRTWSAGASFDVETAWVTYTRNDNTSVLMAIDSADQSIHHTFTGVTTAPVFNVLPRQRSSCPSRSNTSGLITTSGTTFQNYHAGFCMSSNYVGTLNMNVYNNFHTCNSCGSATELYHHESGAGTSGSSFFTSVYRNTSGVTTSTVMPADRQSGSFTFTEAAYPHAASVHNAPKCAGVRTVWNTTPSPDNGGEYDLTMQIVTGELDGTLFGMTVDAVYKEWNYTGFTSGRTKKSAMDDVFGVPGSGNTAHNLCQVLGYIEDQEGNKLVYYIPPLTPLGTSVAGYNQQESVLEYNGTAIHENAFNATITHGGLEKTGRWIFNAALTDHRSSFPDDSGDRAKIIIYYVGSGTHYLQFLDEDLNVLDSQVTEFPGLLTGPSDAYCYSYTGSGSLFFTFNMTRLDCAFSKAFSGRPLAIILGSSDSSPFEIDVVKRTEIDNLTPPLDEDRLI